MACGLADALAARGNRVFLVSWDTPGYQSVYAVSQNVTRCPMGFHPGIRDKVRRLFALVRLLRRERVQVLIGFVMSGDRTVFAAARMVGVRLVVAERNAPSMYRWRHTALQRWQCFALLRLADRIAVQFEDFAGGYPTALRARIAAIPNPVSPAGRSASPGTAHAAGRHTLLAAVRLDETQKRLTCLVDAFARIAGKHPTWDLEIVGDGPDESPVAECIAEHGLGERVRLAPARPEIADSYAASHLFAIPSRWEGFPNALAEAMAHGLPAVGFAGADGVRHLIEDGATGWLAPGLDDPATLAATLDRAMGDPAERGRRGARATRAMRAYMPEAQYDKWQALIDDLAGAERS